MCVSYLEQIFGKIFSVVESFQVGDELAAGHPLAHVLHAHTHTHTSDVIVTD